jgi:hypothetical protein
MSQFYTQVKNPSWADIEHTIIDCEVNFNHLPDEFVPFAANPNDVMEYSVDIFTRCLAGEFGEIAEYVAPVIPEYVPPPEPTKEELMAQIQALMVKVESLS